MTQYDIIIAIEPLESLVGLKLMIWIIPGVINVFTPGMKLYSMRVFYPKMVHTCWIMTQYVIIVAIETLESLVGDIHWGTLGPHKALLDTFQVSSYTLMSTKKHLDTPQVPSSPLK